MNNLPLSRRSVLAGGAAVGAGVAAGALGAPVPALAVPKARPGRIAYPFLLGIASGDPTADGVVLWTRLAVDPLAEDGFGGMTASKYDVEFQVATDEQFRSLVRRGTKHARREDGYAIHVELTGLPSGREFFYRFRIDEHVSPVGRTLTAPSAGAAVSSLRTGVVSCAQFEHGYFTAYRRLAEDTPDLVLHLGDYIYEYRAGAYTIPGGNPRDHAGPETTTLAGYRQRHAQYKSDADLQAAHAVAPWVVVFDDHEVENNWAADISENAGDSVEYFRQRRAAAFKAYYENMPLRRAQVAKGAEMQLYRRLGWGQLANFHMLDTRQYRDDQANNDGLKAPSAQSRDPRRSIMGIAQERWLYDGLGRSTATWDVLGQQVFFALSDFGPGTAEVYNMDSWDGYQPNRDRVMSAFQTRGVANPVVLTGDIHTAWANDLKADFRNTSSKTVGTELVTTSVTSGGDGTDIPSYGPAVRAENPHIKFASNRRGYVLATYTPTQLRADFRSLAQVRTPGAPVYTQASFAVEAGNPGLQSV
ncbi:alkaline phosphatase D family protein [Motilibacter aurantiacus]|uniref:alkaline phosphatase D family protein n=1 Tax=Motilibacter aurantiacus TaxID=2714955 RepID=UPI0014074616|nr:alkaline phosphatase D family protein [Motilibacter aurantiacus]NHC47213.1 alkaline phosphatase [Motilibacter aurantiacus]